MKRDFLEVCIVLGGDDGDGGDGGDGDGGGGQRC